MGQGHAKRRRSARRTLIRDEQLLPKETDGAEGRDLSLLVAMLARTNHTAARSAGSVLVAAPVWALPHRGVLGPLAVPMPD
jgi:hypothetical protein